MLITQIPVLCGDGQQIFAQMQMQAMPQQVQCKYLTTLK